jgi:hypothetical protein
MYYRMVVLTLLQHGSLVAFSDQIKRNANKEKEDMQNILDAYSTFVNQMYFRDVTAQDQGIELYNTLHKQLEIAEEVVALERELRSRHDLLVLKAAEAQQQEAERLNRILALLSTILIVPGLVVGYYGANLFDNELRSIAPLWLLGILLATGLATLLGDIILRLDILGMGEEGLDEEELKDRKKWRPIRIVGFILIAIVILGLPILNSILYPSKSEAGSSGTSKEERNSLQQEELPSIPLPDSLLKGDSIRMDSISDSQE